MPKKFLLPIILLIILILPGCLSFKSKKKQGPPSLGGIFLSENRGKTWKSASKILNIENKNLSLHKVDILSLAIDPQDEKTLYAGTNGQGVFISYDNGLSWLQSRDLNNKSVQAIAVDPKNKCTIYVSSLNTLLKSIDCARTWKQIFFDTRNNLRINTIAVDSYDPRIVYIGTNDGDIIKSKDSGVSWFKIKKIDSEIIKIIIAKDTRNLAVATKSKGVFVSNNKGETWSPSADILLDYIITDFVSDIKNNVLFVSTDSGLIFRSNDYGKTWRKLKLITGEDESSILNLAVNVNNGKEIYYTTYNALYKTFDGGQNWISSQLPTPSKSSILKVNPKKENQIYLGFTIPNK